MFGNICRMGHRENGGKYDRQREYTMAKRRMTKQERTRQIYLRVCFVCLTYFFISVFYTFRFLFTKQYTILTKKANFFY